MLKERAHSLAAMNYQLTLVCVPVVLLQAENVIIQIDSALA